MKYLFFSILLSILSFTARSQRTVDNVFFNDIDDFNVVDTLISKYKLYYVELFGCRELHTIQDSCILYCKMRYDETGRLIELIKGDNLSDNKIDYTVHYKKISDTLFQTIARYPANSTMIPDEIFIDTIIKGRRQKFCLYGKDNDGNIVIKSLYRVNSDIADISVTKEVKRYDLNEKLIQIFYPTGSRLPKKQWADTLVNEFSKEIISNVIYAENYFRSVNIYNKQNELIESSYSNATFERESNDLTRQIIIYDNHKPALKITVDKDQQLLTEEKYSYKNGVLKRYTKDNDLNDSLYNEERHYNDEGRIIFFQSRPSYSKDVTVWKYSYDRNGLRIQGEYFLNGKFKTKRMYNYR